MKTAHTLRVTFASVLLMAGLAAQAADLPASAPVPACPPRHSDMRQAMQQHQQKRLDQLAQALKLRPAQQAAWQAYTQAELALPPAPACPSAAPTAPDMARARAEHARLMAEHFAASSKALSALWQQLTPEQRQTFDKLARQHMPRHGMMDHPHGEPGPMPQ
ncbi:MULTISPECIES: Spy/CpxP family protein refolding chaperone [unclassified Paludibacterium]|uniref:Spy/CpxP family protein refolding chaperone n=1 Tax=unclassified Paludibacterium TaxID=2618429 RepID=UPI001C048489|nr:Spy/CpxP family protein refolding chaperone [Paludibacterium sp. B53371]BEV71128.1 hypothetical protein THUN1379_06100 [Paludibacterium sp. THUN1379]